MDLFSSDPPQPAQKKASEDLLQLGNPFADIYTQPTSPAVYTQPSNIWMSNTNGIHLSLHYFTQHSIPD